MSDLAITGLLVLSLFLILGSGVWIGLTLSGVAWIGMQLFSARPAGDAMAVTIWGSASSWTLTALPLFIWMGEILFRTRLSQDMFKGLAPWVQALPGRLLHTNVIGCTIFAAVSGSSAATCATIGKMTLPELTRRGYPENMVVGTLAGASTLGLLIPPSIIMIVYGVTAEVSISQLFIAGVMPGILLGVLFSGYIVLWALRNPSQVPAADERMTFMQKLSASRSLIPVVLLIVFFIALGCFLDGISMVVLTIAVLLPTVEAAGFDLVWFGIFIVLVVEMAQITPPVGFNLFVIQGLTRREIMWIARTAFPLFVLMIFAVIATYFMPDIVLWLPNRM